MILAAQLYTLRDYTGTAEGFRDALRRCSEIGYQGVQLSAVGCMNGEHPEVDANAAKRMLDDYNLLCCATHRPWRNFVERLDEEIEFHRILGCGYTAVGSIQGDFGEEPESYDLFLKQAEPIAARLEDAGIRFGYHNHSHEFARDRSSGETCYEKLIAAAWLQLEVDTYWVAHAGICPEQLMRRLRGRIDAVHLKDVEVVPKDGPVMAPVGEGNLNWPEILESCKFCSTEWLIIEQDICRRDPFDCLDSSYRYLRDALTPITAS
jgi:sugar phosphate isomerase/epimerase